MSGRIIGNENNSFAKIENLRQLLIPVLIIILTTFTILGAQNSLAEDEEMASEASESEASQNDALDAPKSSGGYNTSTILGAPRYTYLRPRWGFNIGYAARALGNIDMGQSVGGASSSSMLSLGLDLQPRSWQDFGVFGFGVTGAVYPTRTRTTRVVLKNPYDAWSAGFNFRYQARYWHEQILVPYLGYTYQRLYYTLADGPSGFTVFYGPSVGLQLYLNRLESQVSADAYIDTGILRSYLTLEGQQLSGEDEIFSLGGFTYVLGLRVEF